VLVAISGAVVAGIYRRAGGDPAVTEVGNAMVIGTLAVVGAVLTLAVPDNRVGRLLLTAGIVWGCGEALTEAGVYGVLDRPGAVPGAPYLAAVGPALRGAGWLLAVVGVPALVPDGRLPGARWRWLGCCTTAAVVVLPVGIMLGPSPDVRLVQWRNPLTLPADLTGASAALSLAGILLAAISVIGGVAALVARWRRGSTLVHQQLLVLAAAACPPAVVVLLVPVLGGVPAWGFDLGLLPLPVAIAVATLQHGLYDLRRAAHRTLLWVTMSGVVVALYALVIAGVTAVAPAGGGRWLPPLAAATAALVLVPLRAGLQRAVNRIVYGRWHEPYEMLTALSGQLEAAADIDRLLEVTIDELRTGLDLREVGLQDVHGETVAGDAGTAPSVPLLAYGTTVGRLAYRAPARQLSDSELRLLRDLSRHLGVAMHARMLRDDLQRTRERLVLAREEERRRLRRDLHDGVGPALAGLRLKAETARILLPAGSDGAARQLESLSEEIRATVTDVRRLVEGLRPPALDELGLLGAWDQAVQRLTQGSGVEVLVAAPAYLPPLPAAVEVAAYRIVVEAVTNVVRHSGADRCAISVTLSESALVLTVTDDGHGLRRSADSGNGLAIMRERAEELGGEVLASNVGSGVRVEARLPLGVVNHGARRERARS
jgi:signal transduction histidine kinase